MLLIVGRFPLAGVRAHKMDILIKNQPFKEDDPNLQNALAGIYRQKVERPLCLCRLDEARGGVPLYVAKKRDAYCVRRLPNTREQHAPHCKHYQHDTANNAIQPASQPIKRDLDAGSCLIKLAFPMTMNSSSSHGAPHRSQNALSAPSRPEQPLSLLSLLIFLWEEAQLSQPVNQAIAWSDARTALLDVASSLKTRYLDLDGRILIPNGEASLDRREDATLPDIQRGLEKQPSTQFFNRLAITGRRKPIGIVIAPFEKIEVTHAGFLLRLKHLPMTPLIKEEHQQPGMLADLQQVLSRIEAGDQLLCIASVFAYSAAAIMIERLGVMPINAV